MGVDEIAGLSKLCADSGVRLKWPADVSIADLASTGGPGSLSTLIGPLALVTLGANVVKLAVPGRPAGAIDTLGTIPGYRVNLASTDVTAVMRQCRFAHFLADHTFTPLDAELFSYRRKVNAIAVPPLAIASLLSKKLAVGVHAVGLDVRVGEHGNFGTSLDHARANAALFCRTAKVLGIDAVCFLSSIVAPAQPFVGRGESLVAIANALGWIDTASSPGWLNDHVQSCLSMASIVRAGGPVTSGSLIRPALSEALSAHLVAQGSSIEAFMARVEDLLSQRREPVVAPFAGELSVNVDVVRAAIVACQNDKSGQQFSDPCGIEFLCRPGDLVDEGQIVAVIRFSNDAAHSVARLRAAFTVTEPSYRETEAARAMEVVRA